MKTPRCPKCDARMGEGFLLDSAHNAARVARWVEGAPEYWILRMLKLRGRRKLSIESFRCTRCGYLESYANEPATS